MIGSQALKEMLSARTNKDVAGLGSKKGESVLYRSSAIPDDDPFGKPNTKSKSSLLSGELSDDPEVTAEDREAFGASLLDLYATVKPDTWNNIPVCLVKSITILLEALT